MGYREDGNFNIKWTNDGDSTTNKYKKENAPFLFPDEGVRFLQAQAALDTKFNRGGNIPTGSYKIHRGYIRNLEQPAFGEVPIMRCNFQFNPQQIQQNVAMRDDVYLPLLQPPEQLAQPLGANTNFSFDLLFDRSQELSKGTPSSGVSYNGTADAASKVSPTVTADPFEIGINDAYDIGVLADLRVFYAVIGQGFSAEMLDFQSKMFKYNADSAGATNQPTSGTESSTDSSGTTASTTTTPTTPPTDTSMSNIQSVIQANAGNFALLMPNPVRVMFSSLFMVDGFITSTSVDFLKFSGNMVPLQCRIAVTMNAMYIGFAKQKTFLTDLFQKAADEAERRNAEQAAQLTELSAALTSTCSSFLIGSAFDSGSIDWDEAAKPDHTFKLPIWTMAVDDSFATDGTKERSLFTGFTSIVPKKGNGEQKSDSGSVTGEGSGRDTDNILRLYEDSSAINFTYTWNINVWGRKKNPLNEAQAQAFLKKTDQLDLVGSFSRTETSSSKDQWGSGKSGDGAKAERIRRRSYRGGDITNSADARWRGVNVVVDKQSAAFNTFINSYFIVEITVNLSASVGNSEPITASWTNNKKILNGNTASSTIYQLIPLLWTSNTVNPDYSFGSGAGSSGGTSTVPSIPVNGAFNFTNSSAPMSTGSSIRPLSPEERRALGRETDSQNNTTNIKIT